MSFITLAVPLISYAVAKSDFVGAWLFDEGCGDSVRDQSKNVKDGKVINAKWINGKFGMALEFEGGAVVADGKWHHVAMTYDGTTLRGYVERVCRCC